jgi:hypothetical protein
MVSAMWLVELGNTLGTSALCGHKTSNFDVLFIKVSSVFINMFACV